SLDQNAQPCVFVTGCKRSGLAVTVTIFELAHLLGESAVANATYWILPENAQPHLQVSNAVLDGILASRKKSWTIKRKLADSTGQGERQDTQADSASVEAQASAEKIENSQHGEEPQPYGPGVSQINAATTQDHQRINAETLEAPDPKRNQAQATEIHHQRHAEIAAVGERAVESVSLVGQ